MEEILEEPIPPQSEEPVEPEQEEEKKPFMKFEFPEFKRWEWALIAVSTFVFVVSLYLYMSDVSISARLMGIEDNSKKVEVGFLLTQTTPTKRKSIGSIQYKDIPVKTTLFNKDTLVTEADSTASLQLNDGSIIELGPSTMIQLSFDSRFGLGGISRGAKVDVISGSVEGKNLNSEIRIQAGGDIYDLAEQKKVKIGAARPKVSISDDTAGKVPEGMKDPWLVAAEKEMKSSPKITYDKPGPSLEFKMLYPQKGATISPPKEAKSVKIPLAFKWTMNRAEDPVMVKIYKMNGAKGELIGSVVNRAKTAQRSQTLILPGPGKYRWELDLAHEESFAEQVSRSADFAIDSEIIGIKLAKPTTANRSDTSEIKLTWTPYAGTKNYVVGAYRDKEMKQVIWQKKLTQTEFTFDLKSVILGKIDPQVYFNVTGASASGINVKSNLESIEFGFFNTEPVIPTHNENISETKLKNEDKRMIFTWEKKHLASAYAFELATDPNFKQMIRRVGTRENFVLLDPLRPGSYYWRIRVAIVGIWGPISGTHTFQMTP